jgi:hypothetical protein
MLVQLVNGNYEWDLQYDVENFWDRFLDGIAKQPRCGLPRDLIRTIYKEARHYGVDYAELLNNRVELYA